MRLNPFTKQKEDDMGREISARRSHQELELASQSTPEEQILADGVRPEPGLTKWQQDLHPWLQKMVHRLKSEFLDDNDVWMPVPGTRALCSDECIYKLVALLEPNISPTVINSKLSEERISTEMFRLEKTVILKILLPELEQNGHHHFLQDNMSEVKKIFRSFAMPTYYRAFGGFEAMNQRQIRSVKELHTGGIEREVPKKKGGFLGL